MVNLSPEHKLQKTESINQSILPLAILPFLNSASLAWNIRESEELPVATDCKTR